MQLFMKTLEIIIIDLNFFKISIIVIFHGNLLLKFFIIGAIGLILEIIYQMRMILRY